MDALKPGGGYVCGSSHSIVNYVPHENFIAMLNAIHRYGAYDEKCWTGAAPSGAKQEKPAAGQNQGKGGGLLARIYSPASEGDLSSSSTGEATRR